MCTPTPPPHTATVEHSHGQLNDAYTRARRGEAGTAQLCPEQPQMNDSVATIPQKQGCVFLPGHRKCETSVLGCVFGLLPPNAPCRTLYFRLAPGLLAQPETLVPALLKPSTVE